MAGALEPLSVLLVTVEMLVLALFVIVLGLIFSLQLRSSLGAMGATATTVFLAGGGYLFCLIPVSSWFSDEWIYFACVPFLLAFPLLMDQSDWRLNGNDLRLMATCVAGVLIYAFVTLVLWGVIVGSFDLMAGRTSGPSRRRS